MSKASFVKKIVCLLGASLAVQWTSCAFAAEPSIGLPTCADDPVFRDQDFALGTWDVFAGDTLTAHVHMERALNDCAIREVWTVAEGQPGNGLGLFTYSRLLKIWQYLWAADTGNTTAFTGSQLKPGEMRYLTTRPLSNGGVRHRDWRLILQPDGRVRELSVGSDDGGKTWTTEYDLMWVKVIK